MYGSSSDEVLKLFSVPLVATRFHHCTSISENSSAAELAFSAVAESFASSAKRAAAIMEAKYWFPNASPLAGSSRQPDLRKSSTARLISGHFSETNFL